MNRYLTEEETQMINEHMKNATYFSNQIKAN